MLFNSYIFIPYVILTISLYYISNIYSFTYGKIILILSSFVYYYLNEKSLFCFLIVSVLINFLLSFIISKSERNNEISIYIAIAFNIALLIYFKYTNFVIDNINDVVNTKFYIEKVVSPLGISFITFQQISYCVSISKKEIDLTLIDYLSYILFFPKLIMGPLMEPSDFYEQINRKELKKINISNVAKGIKLFSFGLFKKMVLADTFSKAVNFGFQHHEILSSFDLILVSLFYTFEIYYDFSGYSDMAVGTSLFFNIVLPINFNSPYKALSIDDFWKRWHISLTSFFRKYLYIPLGGNRKGKLLTYINIFIIFFVSGIWHGANWTFILFGTVYGLLMILNKAYIKKIEKIFEPFKWIVTFSIICILWTLFRSESISQFIEIMKKIVSFSNTSISNDLMKVFLTPEVSLLRMIPIFNYLEQKIRGFWMIVCIIISFIVILIPNNNYQTMNTTNIKYAVVAAVLFAWSFISMANESQFVYFGF